MVVVTTTIMEEIEWWWYKIQVVEEKVNVQLAGDTSLDMEIRLKVNEGI